MLDRKNRITLTVACLFALAALILGIFISQHVREDHVIDVQQFHGTYLDKPRAVKAFSLTGIDNKSFNNASLLGHWTMMFFGFTNCGHVCPTTMAELGKMYRLIEDKGVKTLPQIVMISVDPERDSLDKLDHYVKAFHPEFYGARGDEASIAKLSQELGVAYTKMMLKGHDDSQHYDIEHTGTVMLFNPKGELNAFFTMPHQASFLAKDYLLLVS